MSEAMVKAVLDRIPDYRVDLDGVHQYLGNPSMTGLGTPRSEARLDDHR